MQNKTIFGRLDGLVRLLDIRLYKNSVSLYTIGRSRIVTKYNKKRMVTSLKMDDFYEKYIQIENLNNKGYCWWECK